MKNPKNTKNNLKLGILFIIIGISVIFLVRNGEYKNILILVLTIASIYFGFSLKQKREKGKEPIMKPLQQKPQQNIPQEFKDQQDKFKKLSDSRSLEGIKFKEEKIMEETEQQTQEPGETPEQTPEEKKEETEDTGSEETKEPTETGEETPEEPEKKSEETPDEDTD